jgi:hypothetical protein
MGKYTLKATLPIDENYEKTSSALVKYSFRKIYTCRLCPPNLMEYVFENLGEYGAEVLKTQLMTIYEESKYKEYCRFEIKEVNR